MRLRGSWMIQLEVGWRWEAMQCHFSRARILFLVSLLLVSSLASCAGLGTEQEIPLTLVPITDVKEVEGT